MPGIGSGIDWPLHRITVPGEAEDVQPDNACVGLGGSVAR